MTGGFDGPALAEVLGVSQRLGFIGARPVDEAIEHSRGVVGALVGVTGRIVDIGAGGGLPGLVVVHDRPDLHVTMIDRRLKRTDFLERMVRRHGLTDRVDVLGADAEHIVDECERGSRPRFDAGVARGFGPPAETLRIMGRLVRSGGRLIVTEPPDGDRWDPTVLEELGLDRQPDGVGVAVFQVR